MNLKQNPIRNGIIIFMVVVLFGNILLWSQAPSGDADKRETTISLAHMSMSELRALVDDPVKSHNISSLTVLTNGSGGPLGVIVYLKQGINGEHNFYVESPAESITAAMLMEAQKQGVSFGAIESPEIAGVKRALRKVQESEANPLMRLVSALWMPALIIAFMIWMGRRAQNNTGGGNTEFGKSKAKLFAPADNAPITLDDVAGCDEAKEEVQDIIRYLKDPKLIRDLGGKPVKGGLMVGPPGTGKTLLARAVAHTAGVPFFITSGSEFVEMFVGAGAARVRDLFAQARKHAPCIVFFDEIDAVGQVRGTGIGGGNDERQQTLNQILVELDGLDPISGVVFIGATNRADTLDPALLRPNRLGDVRISVDLPDVKGRHDILLVHARNKKLADDVDLLKIAKRTYGYSGAELAGVMDHSVMLAIRRVEKARASLAADGLMPDAANEAVPFSITQQDIGEAIDRVKMGTGSESKSRRLSNEVKRVLAYHEGGHALVSQVLFERSGGKAGAPVRKLTILGRGGAGGYMIAIPDEESPLYNRTSLNGLIAVALGGTISEELNIGDFTTGNANDLEKVYDIAKKMVTKWRMSSLGPISVGEDGGNPFLGMRMAASGGYGLGGESANQIDHEIKKILDEAMAVAKEILVTYAGFLHFAVPIIMEEETLEEERWMQLWRQYAQEHPQCNAVQSCNLS